MAKVLQCGKNRITEPVPVHGFGTEPTKAKAKRAAIDMAHGFAKSSRRHACGRVKIPRSERYPKMIGAQVGNEKTTELLTVKLQNNIYLSVVRRSFDIVIFCQ
jgi:hypothetical protein